MKIARQLMETTQKLKDGIQGIPVSDRGRGRVGRGGVGGLVSVGVLVEGFRHDSRFPIRRRNITYYVDYILLE